MSVKLVIDRFVSRKAVSPLIAVVLIMIFTVAVGTMVMTWMTDYTKTTTSAATEATSGEKGVVYCANSNVEISNVDLKTVIKENTSMSSGSINKFTMDSIGATVDLTFTGGLDFPTNGIVGYWKLDNSVGSIASDAINGNDGVVSGTPIWTSGKYGNAMNFNGIDNQINISYSPL